MRASLPVGVLQDALATVGILTDEAVLVTRPTELCVYGRTRSKHARAIVRLDGDAFTTYKTRNKTLGIKTRPLLTLCSILPAETTLKLRTPPHSERLTATGSNVLFQVDPLDPTTIQTGHIKQPSSETCIQSVFPKKSGPLARSLAAANLCGSFININTDIEDPVFEFTASGDTDSMSQRVSREHLDSYDGISNSSTYPVKILMEIHDAVSPQAANLRLTITDNNVLILTAPHKDTAATTQCSLAPQIEGTETGTETTQ